MASSGPFPAQGAPIDTLPTVYTEPPHTTTEDTVDVEFLRGVGGILKIIEMIFSLVTFICASVTVYHKDAAGWIQFVSMTAFVVTCMLYIFHAFKLPPKLSKAFPFKFCELSFYGVFTVFYFISGVVAACFATGNAALSAAAFFAFASMLVFGIDIYFRFTAWRYSNEAPIFSSAAPTGFFTFASMVVFGIDIYFRYTDWRHSNEGPFFSRSSDSNIPPSSSSAERVQY